MQWGACKRRKVGFMAEKERPINKRLRKIAEAFNEPERPARPSNPRAALLDVMKAQASADPDARACFREDVQVILEQWDGRTPLLWFTWNIGTHLMLLHTPDERRAAVWARQRELEAAIDMARGGGCYYVDPDTSGIGASKAYDFSPITFREPLASAHRVDLYV